MNKASRLLVLAASCCVASNPLGLVISFGTLYLPLLEKFDEDRATTATVQSLLIGLTLSTGIIWGILCRKYRLWKVMFVGSVLVPFGFIMSFFAKSLDQLIFCIGILSGVGTSIVYVCSSVAVERTFENKGAGIALAVYNCAIGIGAASYPFMLEFFLQNYYLSGTVLLLGGLNLNNLIVTLLYYNKLNIKTEFETNQETEAIDISIPKKLTTSIVHVVVYVKHVLSRTMSIRLGVFIFAIGISIGCLNGFLVVVLDVLASKNFTSQEGLYSFTVFNACGILGPLLPILFQLKNDVHPMAIFILCSLFGCAGQLIVLKASSVSLMYVGRGLSGIAVGGFLSGCAVALLHFVHKDVYSSAFGLMITSVGIVSNATGPLYGWMRDELQSYDTVIALTAGLLGCSALLFSINMCVTKTVPENIREEVQTDVNIRY